MHWKQTGSAGDKKGEKHWQCASQTCADLGEAGAPVLKPGFYEGIKLVLIWGKPEPPS